MTTVKNLNGTSNRKAPAGYSSWKEFWEDKTKRSFGTCSCSGCSNSAKHGSHVQKVGTDRSWYIVPLCDSCNVGKKNVEFEVRDADLVWVGE